MSDKVEETMLVLTLDLPVEPAALVVHDNERARRRLQEVVTSAGFRAAAAASGIEALAWMNRRSVSMVIAALDMPGMDGPELCRRIRDREWPGYVYLVVLTDRHEESDILAALDAGANDCMSKRTSAAQFTARLRAAKRVLSLEYSLREALDKSRALAMTDPLTGVYNRRYFRRQLSRELKRSQRFGGHVSLLLIDVDHFKRVNDVYGHAIGDMVLRKLTRLIEKCLQRATHWCARLGGEEFAVVLGGANLSDAALCAEKVRQTVEDTLFLKGSSGDVRITVSIGVSGLEAFADQGAVTEPLLLAHADRNLYASKSGGRNSVTASQAGPDRGGVECIRSVAV